MLTKRVLLEIPDPEHVLQILRKMVPKRTPKTTPPQNGSWKQKTLLGDVSGNGSIWGADLGAKSPKKALGSEGRRRGAGPSKVSFETCPLRERILSRPSDRDGRIEDACGATPAVPDYQKDGSEFVPASSKNDQKGSTKHQKGSKNEPKSPPQDSLK